VKIRSGDSRPIPQPDLLADALGSAAKRIREVSPEFHDAVSQFWSAPFADDCLSARNRELIMLALHASATTLHAEGIDLHIGRALDAGATPLEILDVLVSISPLGVHAFAIGFPALLDELQQARGEAELPPISEEADRIKQAFIEKRGYWTEQRELTARLVPNFFKAYLALSSEPWQSGALDAKTRELVYIAIDCSITHMYDHGLRIHIRNALKHGATPEEILQVFTLAATIGVNAYVAGAKALAARLNEDVGK
jgi:alkylhydroperoxidase/carboxymuconolactone decarboxylase family protein YurZ